MSWSVSSIGKIEDVRKELNTQFSSPHAVCPESEETLRKDAATYIDKVLESYTQTKTAKVFANGSQHFDDHLQKTGCTNAVSISIIPQD